MGLAGLNVYHLACALFLSSESRHGLTLAAHICHATSHKKKQKNISVGCTCVGTYLLPVSQWEGDTRCPVCPSLLETEQTARGLHTNLIHIYITR